MSGRKILSHQEIKLTSQEKKSIFPLGLLLLGSMLGIAGQMIAAYCIALYLTIKSFRDMKLSRQRWADLPRFGKTALISSSLLVLWTTSISLLNPLNLKPDLAEYIFGYLIWILLPVLLYLAYGALPQRVWKTLGTWLASVSLIWAFVAVSQYFFEWKVVGAHFVHSDEMRPRALFSHPLTFAYAVLLIWPLAVAWVFKEIKNWRAWLTFLGIGLCLVITESRTAQGVAFLIVIFNIFYFLTGRHKAIAIFCLFCTLTGISLTDNILSRKFRQTFSPDSVERYQDYSIDRMVFWHAHSLMFQERPFLGHGVGLKKEYLKPYYEKIGINLDNFKKIYSAHNMFLQILVNSGIIGFLLFFLWVFSYVRVLTSSMQSPFAKMVGLQIFSAFLIACLTQNGFQDASVRIWLTLCCSAILLSTKNKELS